MHMPQSAIGEGSHTVGVHSTVCPYGSTKGKYCSASVMAVALNHNRMARYCSSEDYDRCPLFLAKILRRK